MKCKEGSEERGSEGKAGEGLLHFLWGMDSVDVY